MPDSEEVPKKIGKNCITFLIFLLILYCGIRFLSKDGNGHPLVVNLFNMIILLSFLVFYFHKNEIEEGKKEVIYQATLFKNFKKEH